MPLRGCVGENPKTERDLVSFLSVSTILDQFTLEDRMPQGYKPGEIVPKSGISIIRHDPLHADMPHDLTVIKGRRFSTCRHCKRITFDPAHAAKRVSETYGPAQ